MSDTKLRQMKRFLLIMAMAGAGCATPKTPSATNSAAPVTLTQARQGFKTKLTRQVSSGEKVPDPPAKLFRKVSFPASGGQLSAYLSQSPAGASKLPAIIWITGGDCNTIGEVWMDAPPSNDQTAAAFRKAGIVTMFPSLRGGNDNPGVQEGFFGEVDDVLAAAEYLAHQPQVDPKRIYLGGHSTGGTLVMLVAESSDRFRCVFSFGPASNVAGYGSEMLPFDLSNRRELELRAPVRWLSSIKSPVYVFEGTSKGNLEELKTLEKASKNPLVHFFPVQGASHFSVLAPITAFLATKILADQGAALAITEAEVNAAFAR